ncbi:MAG: TetR/AcrR family transcriptional regulator [Myxococcales bacterium]|nr:TetR/AcrR family transcriptional regulator [Myxococcales bacterium]
MGSSHRIERERLEKRARILDAARDLFVERGVEKVTLREIAQRIEYSTTAIYVQFRDKAALVNAMVTEDFATFAKGLEATAKIADPVARIHAMHLAYIDFALAMPRHYQLLFLTPPIVTPSEPEADTPAGIDGYRVLLGAVEECIRTQRFRAELVDANAVAQTVWAAVHGLVSLQIVVGRHDEFRWASRDSLTRTSYEMIMRGLLRDPGEIGKPRRAKARAR